jgi:signal recognition particle GTPase
VQAKNPEPLAALVTYLEKHRAEIIDDGRRQRVGKPMGSGRMEKGVDQVIGARQKHKGMSRSPTGSKALGILKVVELNQQWEQLWFPQQVAA